MRAGPEVVTFGCRLNAAESDRIAALAGPDLVVVNTCAVTAEAARQGARAVRRLVRDRPGRRVVVTGCASEIERARFAALPGVAAVIPNADKTSPAAWAALGNAPTGGAIPAPPLLPRAFLPVQTGCDHRCTFCVIPFGRGQSRSVPIAEAIAGARRLVDRGAREVVLTGVDLTAYGRDLGEGASLGRLVAALLRALPDLPRLRVSSIDGAEADEDLVDAVAGEDRLMPHLHLSLQAGDDLVLKRMRRRHSRADAIAFCARLRRLRPDIVFGADLIAGFPTETDAMFARSLDLVEECGLTHLHVFPYSARPGTPAARMPPVPAALVAERAARLREAGAAALARHLRGQVGRTLPVLVESRGVGRTDGYACVALSPAAEPHAIVAATITGHDGRRLIAA